MSLFLVSDRRPPSLRDHRPRPLWRGIRATKLEPWRTRVSTLSSSTKPGSSPENSHLACGPPTDSSGRQSTRVAIRTRADRPRHAKSIASGNRSPVGPPVRTLVFSTRDVSPHSDGTSPVSRRNLQGPNRISSLPRTGTQARSSRSCPFNQVEASCMGRMSNSWPGTRLTGT